MYPTYKKTRESASPTELPNNCYAQKAKTQFWILGIVVMGAMIYTLVAFNGRNQVASLTNAAVPPSLQVQNIASVPCPYCANGFLDAQGRCNNPQCPIYSPDWGKPSSASVPCPYCPGFLDVQGRCNVPQCSIYSPNWGKPSSASVPCPYCPGFLDVQGRCNVPQCSIYSPNWGKPSGRQTSTLRQVLIKELAMEVKPANGSTGVDIHAIYIGGNGEKAGLRAGDIISRFNGRRVKDVEHFQSLVAQATPESNVKIRVIRDQKRIDSTVMVGEGEMEGVTIPVK